MEAVACTLAVAVVVGHSAVEVVAYSSEEAVVDHSAVGVVAYSSEVEAEADHQMGAAVEACSLGEAVADYSEVE